MSFSTPIRLTDTLRAAVPGRHDDPDAWTPAIRQDGSLVGLAGYSDRTRLIVRREPLHLGGRLGLLAAVQPGLQAPIDGVLTPPGRSTGR